jgi:hydrogenase nickel incorporation protein HypB
MKIAIEKAVTARNDSEAQALRTSLKDRAVYCMNLVSGPGAGKTSLIEQTVLRLKSKVCIAVIEAGPHTGLDSERVMVAGALPVQIDTGSGCHLDARMIRDAVSALDLSRTDLLIIENIGNLLCPSAWDLGEETRVVVSSLPEGSDKPLKYPETFISSQVLVINKTDLAPFLPVKSSDLRRNALAVNPHLTVFEVSCLTGEGLDPWCGWVLQNVRREKA